MASCLFISTCGLALGLVNSIPYQEDGTYRLALQEYVLIVGGIPCTRLNTRAGGDDRSFEYSNSILVPLFCLTKTECFLSYERYNKVLRALPKLLFDAEDGVGGALLVSHGGLDMTSAILNAFRGVWPGCLDMSRAPPPLSACSLHHMHARFMWYLSWPK